MLIPKLIRERTRAEKCVDEVNGNLFFFINIIIIIYDNCLSFIEFNECCLSSGVKMIVTCRKENEKMKKCIETWFYNDDFIKECTEQYLNDRAEYRKTGIPKKQRKNRVDAAL